MIGKFTIDSFEVTESIQSSYGSFNANEGNQYVAVTITVKNVGTTADIFLSSFAFGNTDVSAKIIYQETYEFSGTNLLGYSEDISDKTLNPLTSFTGIKAYQVVNEAANSDEMAIQFTLGKETVSINLK